MYKRFFLDKLIDSDIISIEGEEHNHICNVIRMRTGDKIIVVCNDEYDYICEIQDITKRETICRVLEKKSNDHNPTKCIDVFQALVKNDKMSMIVQKLNELGVANLRLFHSKYQTVKPSENKQDKLQKISNQSSKQCKRSKSMIIHDSIAFDKMIELFTNYDLVLFANECEKSIKLSKYIDKIKNSSKIAIIIGSEGGFEEQEIKKIIKGGGVSISLGSRILRAETASIAMAGYVSILLDN
ncbi:MAG: 16S rRNA (uracil(1498)-N(3))-methyltransferase [Clostridiales bacterium]|nr:16S rRNA (uracil(1498)-N(3))-methyltransferase [Clostridiales bacterium]